MYILGINAYHPDASVCLLKNGVPVWSAEEERFNRIKHSSGFPHQALLACLKDCKVSVSEIEIVAISKKPSANLMKKLLYTLRYQPSFDLVLDRLKVFKRASKFEIDFFKTFSAVPNSKNLKFVNVEHHQAHIASTCFVSGFKETAFLSLDGMGDFSSAVWGQCRDQKIQIFDRVYFPYSMGFFYTAATQFLGFHHFGDEYKVMGLAAYGKPIYVEQLKKMIKLKQNGSFSLDLNYFTHHNGKAKVQWQGGSPTQEIIYSELWEMEFGKARKPKDEITQREKDLAASAQLVFEEVYFYMLKDLHKKTGFEQLCLAGGCALNSLANGKIIKNTPFEKVYIQAASNDSGTALGAALFAHKNATKKPISFVMKSASLGPSYEDEIKNSLENSGLSYGFLEEDILVGKVVDDIVAGKVVGWFQGRMELGPRALGNRSILADARRPDMKGILNQRIKIRETFRPFAPAIPVERAQEFFEMDCDETPFMLKVFPVKENYREKLPAITHVDGTARIQTVSKETNEIFWKLLNAFGKKTGIPILINTSFNENEPIVCTPEDAINCFKKTRMDVLVLGTYYITRDENFTR